MQKLTRSLRGHRERHTSSYRDWGPEPDAAIRDAPAAGIRSLAGRFGQALPTLDNVATSYEHELNSELLYDLCACLVRCGLGQPSHWNQSGGIGIRFVKNVIRDAITDERLELFERNVEYHLQVSDVIDRYGYDRGLDSNELAVIINSGNCGYLEIGQALEALEKIERGLGTAFYWELTNSLDRVMRIYNHENALRYEEHLQESAEQEEDEARDQYEFPEVQKSLPQCIRKTMKSGYKELPGRRLLYKHRNGAFGAWISLLRRIQTISRLYPTSGRDLGDGYYDSDPLPSLLIVFNQHDAVTACFDEESQYMFEGSCEPTLSIVFSPQDESEFLHAKNVVERFILLNCALFKLVEDIQNWRSNHEHRDVDRGELSLRTA